MFLPKFLEPHSNKSTKKWKIRMSPGRSLCVRRPRGVGGLGRERTGIGQATHRVIFVLFHLARMNKVKGIF
jgi:hypothetical protein